MTVSAMRKSRKDGERKIRFLNGICRKSTRQKQTLIICLAMTGKIKRKNRSDRDGENKEQSDAATSGQHGPRFRVWGWPKQASSVPFVATEELLAL